MGRYKDEDLKEWALMFVRDFNDGGPKALHVIMTISAITGMEFDAVVEHIKELARQ